jgi:hypothetical protein
MHTIVIIGCGQLGKRYIESLYKISKIKMDIYINDINIENLNKIKCQYESIRLDSPPKNIDLLIITTCAPERMSIVKKMSENHIIKFMLLEKLLFVDMKDYIPISVPTWVNCPRRTYSYYNKIKQTLRNENKSLYMYIDGNDWNMCSNAIHFVDLYGYLTDITPKLKLEYEQIIESKRAGFSEIYGYISDTNNRKMKMISRPPELEDTNLIKILVTNDKCIIIINTKDGIIIIQKPENKVSIAKHKYVSETMYTHIEDILLTGDCNLTKYEESVNYHKSLLEILPIRNIT